jgi:Retrotransposon gag protein
MKDQALIWLRSLPAATKNNIQTLTEEFKQRHAPSIVDKWRKTKDIWSRQQGASESVNDYIPFMQAAAQKAGMDEGALIHPIIRGLKPDIRLFVLHNDTLYVDIGSSMNTSSRNTETRQLIIQQGPAVRNIISQS